MADLERIRDHFDPVPTDVFHGVKSDREADFVKREFRSLARFGRYLEEKKVREAGPGSDPAAASQARGRSRKTGPRSRPERIQSAYPALGGSSQSRPRRSAGRAGAKPSRAANLKKRRIASAYPVGVAAATKRNEQMKRDRRRKRRIAQAQKRRPESGKGAVHAIRIPDLFEELSRQRKLAKIREEAKQSAVGTGRRGFSRRPMLRTGSGRRGRRLTSGSSRSATASAREKLTEMSSGLTSLSSSAFPSGRSRRSGRSSRSGRVPSDPRVSVVPSVLPRVEWDEYSVKHRADVQGEDRRAARDVLLILNGEFTRSEKRLIGEHLRVFDEDKVGARKEEEEVEEGEEEGEIVASKAKDEDDPDGVEKLTRHLKRIRPLVLDGKLDLNLFFFEPEVRVEAQLPEPKEKPKMVDEDSQPQPAQEAQTEPETETETETEPEPEVEVEAEGESVVVAPPPVPVAVAAAELPPTVADVDAELRLECPSFEGSGYTQYYVAAEKSYDWVPVEVLHERPDTHHTFVVEIKLAAGEDGVHVEATHRLTQGADKKELTPAKKRKEVGRVNLFFKSEDKREFLRSLLFAVVRRKRMERLLTRRKQIEAIQASEISNIREEQVDNIMQLVSNTFPMEYVRLIKNLLMELESTYVYALKKSIREAVALQSLHEQPTVVTEAEEEYRDGDTSRRLALLSELDHASGYRRSKSLVDKYIFLNNPTYLDIILSINREIYALEDRWPIFEKTISFPIEIHQFVETQRNRIEAFLKFFRKEFMIRMINVIQQHITNDVFNFYKVDSMDKYNDSRMKRFIQLITYVLRSKVELILQSRMSDFVGFLNSARQSFFLIVLLWVQPSKGGEAAAQPGVEVSASGSLQFVPAVDGIFSYIRREILEYLVTEMNAIPSLANELYSSLNINEPLFQLTIPEEGNFDVKKLSASPNRILGLYREFCGVLEFTPKYVHQFIAKFGDVAQVQIGDFEAEVARLQKLAERIDCLSDNEVFAPLFHMKVAQFKANLRSKVEIAKSSVLNYIAECIYSMNRNLTGKYEEIFERLQKRPDNAEQLSGLKEYAMTVKTKLASLLTLFRKVEDYHNVLFQFHYLMKPNEFEIYMRTFEWPRKIESVLNSSMMQMEYLKQQFIERLHKDTRDLELEIDTFYGKLAKIKHFNDLQNLELYDHKIKKYEAMIQKFTEQTTLFNRRERLFAFAQTTAFGKFEKLKAEYEPYFKLWNIIFDESQEFPSWESGRFLSLNYTYMKDKLKVWIDSLNRLRFPELRVHHVVREKLLKFQPHLKLVKYLLEPGLKPRHWKMILGQGDDVVTSADSIKLLDLIEMNLISEIEQIKRISLNAQREFQLEKRIERMEDNLKKYSLDRFKISVIVEMLNDQLVEMKKLQQNQFIRFFDTEMTRLQEKIHGIIEILQLWKRFKKKHREITSIYKKNSERLTSEYHILRLAPPHVPWIDVGLLDAGQVEQPHHVPLEAETVSAMRARAELPLVGVPVVRLGVEPLILVPPHEKVMIVLPH